MTQALVKTSSGVAKELSKALFYSYRQNNSGGSFRGPALWVIVQAHSSSEADRIVQEHDVYFNGCDAGNDCSCCGDRWNECWGKGNEVPSTYDTPLAETVSDRYLEMSVEDCKRAEIPYAKVIYLDGTVVTYNPA